MAIDKKKIGLIHVAKTRLRLADEDYRMVLLRAAGVESSLELDDFGFNQVMGAFARLGFKSDFAERNFGERIGMASPQKVDSIRRLWAEFTDGTGTEAQLGKWLHRQFKVDSIRFLDPATANKADGALRVMCKRKAMKNAG